MKRNRSRVREQIVHLFPIGVARRIALGVVALVAASALALVVWSAPQREGAQAKTNQQTMAGDWQAVAQALGKAGSMQPGDVYKVSLPRSDLKVTVKRGRTQTSPCTWFVGGVQKNRRDDDGDGRSRSD